MNNLEKNFSNLSHDDNFYKVLSIDIGVNHLGLSYSFVNHKYELEKILWIDLIDITIFKHSVVSHDKCKLKHSKTFCDWVDHVIQENEIFFTESDFILVERQPPMSPFTAIEQLIFYRYREKTILISPCSVHKHFSINHLDYDKRKEMTVKIAYSKLCGEDIKEKFESYERKHDIGDSIAQLVSWCEKNSYEHRIKIQRELQSFRDTDTFKYLESFRYVQKNYTVVI